MTVTCPCYNILSHKCYLYFFPRPHVIMRQAFTPPHSHKEDYSVCVCSASVFTPPRRYRPDFESPNLHLLHLTRVSVGVLI